MKLPFAILMVVTILYCNSQTKTDLLSLKLNSKVPAVVLQNKELKRDIDPNLGLAILNTAKLENYSIGEIDLNSYTFHNGNAADYSNLYILLSSKQHNNYLGFNYSSVNQQGN